MTQKFILRDDNGTERTFKNRSDAQEQKAELEQLGADVELEAVEDSTSESVATTDESHAERNQTAQEPPQARETNAEVVTEEPNPDLPDNSEDDALAELGEELETDPLSILPGHMTDKIQGKPAVNKRGYAMIAERYGIEVHADIEQFPWENEEKRCVAQATATTSDGKTYSGWATACAEDGDMPEQLIELAETRALKRAISWASGVGIVSYQELSNQLQSDHD